MIKKGRNLRVEILNSNEEGKESEEKLGELDDWMVPNKEEESVRKEEGEEKTS